MQANKGGGASTTVVYNLVVFSHILFIGREYIVYNLVVFSHILFIGREYILFSVFYKNNSPN